MFPAGFAGFEPVRPSRCCDGHESSRLSVHVAVVCQTVAPFESAWAFGADLPATNPDLFSEKMRREFSWETFFWAAAMLVRVGVVECVLCGRLLPVCSRSSSV